MSVLWDEIDALEARLRQVEAERDQERAKRKEAKRRATDAEAEHAATRLALQEARSGQDQARRDYERMLDRWSKNVDRLYAMDMFAEALETPDCTPLHNCNSCYRIATHLSVDGKTVCDNHLSVGTDWAEASYAPAWRALRALLGGGR